MRIGLVIVFTAIFSLSLSVFTEAKKGEIFSATAAYSFSRCKSGVGEADEHHRFAAVEVVFIGSISTS